MGAVAQEIAPHLSAGAIVSDVGSVKGAVHRGDGEASAEAVSHLIPAHPVAGTEQSGPDAGFATLFVNRWCILTPPEGADPKGRRSASPNSGRRPAPMSKMMTPQHHDLVLAITSHVPHLIAYNIVGTAADLEDVTQSEVIKFSAGGFRDFTRIAASDPTMWRDVFLNNKEAVLEMLGRFTEDLTALQRMIRNGDGEGLFNLFTRTRAIRRGIIARRPGDRRARLRPPSRRRRISGISKPAACVYSCARARPRGVRHRVQWADAVSSFLAALRWLEMPLSKLPSSAPKLRGPDQCHNAATPARSRCLSYRNGRRHDGRR